MDKSCKIYFTTKTNLNSIISNISTLLLSLGIESKEIYYDQNVDYNKSKEVEFPDGFLYFNYIIDIEIQLDHQKLIHTINSILKNLWDNNIPAIAACDYEDELLKKGGYKDETIPFPQKKRNRFSIFK